MEAARIVAIVIVAGLVVLVRAQYRRLAHAVESYRP